VEDEDMKMTGRKEKFAFENKTLFITFFFLTFKDA
jgi:hypothetical protein